MRKLELPATKKKVGKKRTAIKNPRNPVNECITWPAVTEDKNSSAINRKGHTCGVEGITLFFGWYIIHIVGREPLWCGGWSKIVEIMVGVVIATS